MAPHLHALVPSGPSQPLARESVDGNYLAPGAADYGLCSVTVVKAAEQGLT